MIYVFYVILVICILILVVGFFIAHSLAYIKKRPDFSLENYKSPYTDERYSDKVKEWIDGTELKYVNVLSPYLYKLNIMIAENKKNDKWIFLLHGVTNSYKYMIDIASFYHKAGYSVVAWDSRAHGKSGGKTTTYGYYEQYDVKAVVDYIRNTYGKDSRIGLHGISMGAAILLMYASHVRDDCSFYIADCPYSCLASQVMSVSGKKIRLKGFPLKVIFEAANFLARILYKFDIKKVDILSKIKRVENPLLFINCRDDDYIDPQMTIDLHEAATAKINELIWFEDGYHAGAFFKHPEEYEKLVIDFLDRIKYS
ncbi:MAG: alpha/beta hydrolase [Clostridia bacterium]|nr:alpha/beta hydrolase [Clostridia bacterium]MBN2882731.1 alpha/beta hydrolase [Clostridia bacterium]